MPSRSLDDCRPAFAARARGWATTCESRGIHILIYCTLRSNVEQDDLYAIGRTTQLHEKIKTNARAGESAHNYGLALDFVPMILGKPQWKDCLMYRNAILLAEDAGLQSLANDPHFSELAHLQMPNWKSLINVGGIA